MLIGCLESLIENPNKDFINADSQTEAESVQNTDNADMPDAPTEQEAEDSLISPIATEQNNNFEPFEYFVDFDEPIGQPLTDNDLYRN